MSQVSQGSELRLKWRYLKDTIARHGVAIGGLGVIAAILLIFFYLFYVVVPLFLPAEVEVGQTIERPGSSSETLYSAVEEQAEISVRIASDGSITFYELATGKIRDQRQLPMEEGSVLTTVSPLAEEKGLLAVGTNTGDVLLLRHFYKLSFPDDVRLITPALEFPYGEEWLSLYPQPEPQLEQVQATVSGAPQGAAASTVVVETIVEEVVKSPIRTLAVSENEERLIIAAGVEDGRLLLQPYDKAGSLFGDEVSLEAAEQIELDPPVTVDHLILTPEIEWLYAASEDGRLAFYDVRRLQSNGAELLDVVELVSGNRQLTALALLSGGISLIVGDSKGAIAQWFPVRDESNAYHLSLVRHFEPMSALPVSAIEVEYGRRGFIVSDTEGQLGIYYATSGRQVLTLQPELGVLSAMAIAPRADMLIAETADGKVLPVVVHNEHPEVSWSALWGKVWYESYPEEDFVWQSSSASNDFEPKFSLVPLSFGTLKAAFYAMLVAMPLAIMGAIYTAYFMAPKMRQMVKPTIEVMEALPTVILGFLAGLWLAPMVESNLPGIFSLLVFLPVTLIAFAYLWSLAPASIRLLVPEGWQAAILVPVVILFGFLCFEISRPLELWLFDGSMPLWLDKEMGISYDQRNALVVGLAMGFAVIPTIFSIAEDAIFSVPKHLSNGSLALGATPWQTLVRVVLPTASPGIFSSVMIGMGRAVGETMIVLMATGNTPLMDGSPFQGMRTLSANIAVEMPESEVGSTHYRILFLAGLVLFLFTFIFNTVAELVRLRLREKYSNL